MLLIRGLVLQDSTNEVRFKKNCNNSCVKLLNKTYKLTFLGGLCENVKVIPQGRTYFLRRKRNKYVKLLYGHTDFRELRFIQI